MRRWFLSYNSQDFALAQPLVAGLKRNDPDAHVFFAPENMRVGGFWLPQLSEEIAKSDTFLLLVGETGIGPWQVMEYYEALDRRVREPNYPVILILSAKRPAPGLPFASHIGYSPKTQPPKRPSADLSLRHQGPRRDQVSFGVTRVRIAALRR
jgi:hypothetical protein